MISCRQQPQIESQTAGFHHAIGAGLCDGLGFKVTRLGGLGNLRTARDICKVRSLPHACDDGFGGDIISAACAHVGATVETHLSV